LPPLTRPPPPAGNPLSPLSHNDVQARDRLVLAIRAAEVFLQDFSSHPKADADRLSQGIRNALSGLRRSVRLADEFADRVELWGLLVRTHCGPGAPVTPGSVDRLKQAVLDAEHLYFGTKTFDECVAHRRCCCWRSQRRPSLADTPRTRSACWGS
jgi:hypothetical protein